MLASLFACLGALILAIVPGFANTMRVSQIGRTTLALTLPPLPKSQPLQTLPASTWHTVSVRSGETLGVIFERLGLPASTMQRLLEHPGAKRPLTQLRVGEEFAFDMPAPGELRAIGFDRGENAHVELHLDDDEVREQVFERAVERRMQIASGEISSSLYAAGAQVGLSNAIINEMANVFSYDIDFAQDLREGDHFSVVYDEIWCDGERLHNGGILAASFSNRGKRYTAVRFERDGKPEYFSAEGRPLKKSFMRMPIEFARISSGFGTRRHPILGRMRMHKGVDYAAGSGTPIMAAGDARVSFAGWKSGYGRAIILDHGRGYSTLYGHMSRFGKYKTGARVGQGQVIGYVGASGLANGPHLHYEFRVGGVHRNPLSVTMPPPEPLRGAMMAKFKQATAPVTAQLQMLDGRKLARAN